MGVIKWGYKMGLWGYNIIWKWLCSGIEKPIPVGTMTCIVVGIYKRNDNIVSSKVDRSRSKYPHIIILHWLVIESL